jgi:hypothetical protein
MRKKHSLSVKFKEEAAIYEGNNSLTLIVLNTSSTDFEEATIRFETPPEITLHANKLTVSPLKAGTNGSVSVALYANRADTYQIEVWVSTFPPPKEGFLHTWLQLDVLPRSDATPYSPIEAIFSKRIKASYKQAPQPETSKKTDFQYRDFYSVYEIGLSRLIERIGKTHSCYSEAVMYQHRLTENIKKSRRFGEDNSRQVERNEIIDGLNQLTFSILGISFNKLCDE